MKMTLKLSPGIMSRSGLETGLWDFKYMPVRNSVNPKNKIMSSDPGRYSPLLAFAMIYTVFSPTPIRIKVKPTKFSGLEILNIIPVSNEASPVKRVHLDFKISLIIFEYINK